MEIDDQLAALAAGELDESAASALRARVAADPALARRLHRIERLDAALSGWTVPPMEPDAVAALDAAVEAALAGLDDAPLRATSGDEQPSPDVAPVLPLEAARERRAVRLRIPTWVAPAAVAAAVFGVVGVGVLSTVGGMSSQDSDETAELAGESEMFEDSSDESFDGAADSAASTAAPGPLRLGELHLASGELSTLAGTARELAIDAARATAGGADASEDGGAEDTEESAVSDDAEADGPAPTAETHALTSTDTTDTARCVDAALAAFDGDDPTVLLLGSGSYDGVEAAFVVLGGGDGTVEAFAFADTDCALLDRVTLDG